MKIPNVVRTLTIRKMLITISLVMNVGLFIILFTPISEYMHKILLTNDQSRESEVIVVMSSTFPFETKNGYLGLSTIVRLEKGLELYRLGLAPKIITFGGVEIKKALKTTGQLMKEKLILYGVPEDDIIVHDDIKGTSEYYDNLLLLLEKYKDTFNFNRAMFVTSAEQSFRIKKSLQKLLDTPVVVTSEPYELSPDWGRRFHLFRRVANEIFAALPVFYFNNRF